jgi:hypothetical protein
MPEGRNDLDRDGQQGTPESKASIGPNPTHSVAPAPLHRGQGKAVNLKQLGIVAPPDRQCQWCTMAAAQRDWQPDTAGHSKKPGA